MIVQLNPALPLDTPRGPGFGHAEIDNGIEHSLYWVVFLANGKVVTFPNEDVRCCVNYTAYRPNPEKPKPARRP